MRVKSKENKLAVNLLIAFYSTADGSGRSGRVLAYLLPRKTHPLLPLRGNFILPLQTVDDEHFIFTMDSIVSQCHVAIPPAVTLADSLHPQLIKRCVCESNQRRINLYLILSYYI